MVICSTAGSTPYNPSQLTCAESVATVNIVGVPFISVMIMSKFVEER